MVALQVVHGALDSWPLAHVANTLRVPAGEVAISKLLFCAACSEMHAHFLTITLSSSSLRADSNGRAGNEKNCLAQWSWREILSACLIARIGIQFWISLLWQVNARLSITFSLSFFSTIFPLEHFPASHESHQIQKKSMKKSKKSTK
jgi:hypothetical protein